MLSSFPVRRFSLPALPHLFGTCFSLLWSPPFSLHAPAPISPSLAKVQLSLTLTPSHLTIWYFEQTALFLLAKAVLVNLPTALSVAPRPPFLFLAGPVAQVSLLKPAPFCNRFAGLGSTDKSATFLLTSSYQTLVLFSPLYPFLHFSFYLKFPGRFGRNCILSSTVISSYNGYPGARFSRGTTQLMSWPDRERYLPPLQSLVFCLLFSLISTLVFSRTGGILSHRNSLTYRFPRFPTRNLCSLVMLAVFSLVFAAMDTAYC